ncbi:MAG: glycosyltransferase family 4 protein [Bacteroidota bacterium]|nr:glycosyltransferase family 4 protein [Bacteroidota bacterium]
MQENILLEFHTTIASFPGDILDRLGSIGPLSEIRRRRFDTSLKALTHTSPFLEAGRMISAKAGLKKFIQHEKGIFSVDAVYKNLDRKIAARLKSLLGKGLNAVYAYEDGALESFKKAHQLKIKCLYDLPIGYWRSARKILDVEKEKWPEWSSTLIGLGDSSEKLHRKDEELRLADMNFVASQFTADTLKDFPGQLNEIQVIPYGFPPVYNQRTYKSAFNKPLKLLFVGGLSQRKGIAELFSVANELKEHIELTIIGKKTTNACKALDNALSQHRWIPTLSHEKILEMMRENDVLVFPSLFEGFGLVITEAMSQGTPVITTERTAGPDLINHGENGWLVEAGSEQKLKEAIEVILLKPFIVREAGYAAMKTAQQRPWHVYGSELAITIKDRIATKI